MYSSTFEWGIYATIEVTIRGKEPIIHSIYFVQDFSQDETFFRFFFHPTIKKGSHSTQTFERTHLRQDSSKCSFHSARKKIYPMMNGLSTLILLKIITMTSKMRFRFLISVIRASFFLFTSCCYFKDEENKLQQKSVVIVKTWFTTGLHQ